jgi:hypothetical protein
VSRAARPVPWLVAVLVLGLTACGKTSPEPDRHPDWVIRSRVVFLSEDLTTTRAPLPLAQFRVLFPYIAGDLYGAPTTGELLDTALGADYAFELNLNRSEKALVASLEPTQFSLPYLRIEPPGARIARLAPMALQADGIDRVGRADWVDSDSKRPLLLVYSDRPATITGQGVAGGKPLRYDIRFDSPGYVWVARTSGADGDVYSVTAKPARLVLAVTPESNDRPTVVATTRKAAPAR